MSVTKDIFVILSPLYVSVSKSVGGCYRAQNQLGNHVCLRLKTHPHKERSYLHICFYLSKWIVNTKQQKLTEYCH